MHTSKNIVHKNKSNVSFAYAGIPTPYLVNMKNVKSSPCCDNSPNPLLQLPALPRCMEDARDADRRIFSPSGGGEGGQQDEGHMSGAAVLQGLRGRGQGHVGVPSLWGPRGEGALAHKAEEHR